MPLPDVTSGLDRTGRALRRAFNRALGLVPEALTTVALLGGWALLTHGIATLAGDVVWSLSGGLLLLSLCGWGFLRDLVTEGLYVLSKHGGRHG